MRHASFEVVVCVSRREDAEALVEHLARAAVRARRRSAGAIVITSRRNSIFSVGDVVDVIVEWLDERPERLEIAVILMRCADAQGATALNRLAEELPVPRVRIRQLRGARVEPFELRPSAGI